MPLSFWQLTCTYWRQSWDQVTWREKKLQCGWGRLLLCRFRINHSSWWNTDQGSVVIGNLIQMLLGNEPRCGRKWTSTRTINSIILSKHSLLKERETPHLWKVELLCVYAHYSSEYHVDDPPRLVLDKLEKIGFRVLTMTGVGQTLVWCLHKETEWPVTELVLTVSKYLSKPFRRTNEWRTFFVTLVLCSTFDTLTATKAALRQVKIKFLNWDYPRRKVSDYLQLVTGHLTELHSRDFIRPFAHIVCYLLLVTKYTCRE